MNRTLCYLPCLRYTASPGFPLLALLLPLVSRRSRSSASESSAPALSQPTDVYGSFSIWQAKSAPKWHAVKKMRYVFWRMTNGRTTTDALREIHWTPHEFYRIIDIEDEGETPFKAEYARAKMLQSRAMADAVLIIAEGRDHITKRSVKQTKRLIERSIRRMNRTKNPITHKRLLQDLLSELRERDKVVITRNKLQMDASKWLAAKMNPNEFADKSSLGLGGLPHPGEGDETTSITIAFVGPDGKEIPFRPEIPAVEASE